MQYMFRLFEPEKHFHWVRQLEQNKRLLFASCPSTSHNTQLTAWSAVIHSQVRGVSRIRELNMATFCFYKFCKHSFVTKDVTKNSSFYRTVVRRCYQSCLDYYINIIISCIM